MFCLYKAERPTFEVALDEKTVVNVYPATMILAQKMQDMNTTDLDITKLYELVAELLSNNKEKRKITVQDIDDFDVSIITEMIVEFSKFMRGVKNDPN